MRGIYKFYQNGELIATQENLITTEGKKAVLRYLAGQTGNLAQSLAVGTGTTAATVGDTRLVFEIARQNINVTSPDFINQKLVFKATLPQEVEGNIYEVGAFTMSQYDTTGRTLLNFDADTEPWSAGVFQTDTTRIGADSLRVNAALSTTTTTSLTNVLFDVTDFRDSDQFTMAYIPQDANLASLKIRLKTDASNYYEYTFTGITAGYKVESFARNQMTKTGSPTWDNITSVDLLVTAKAAGATNVDFDGLRIDTLGIINPDNVMISRTVLGTPVTKLGGMEMDVEYSLDVTI
jgi:hypothetical protein